MQRFYTIFLLGLGLLIGLISCSQKAASERAMATVAAGSVAVPAKATTLVLASQGGPPKKLPVLVGPRHLRQQAAPLIWAAVPQTISDSSGQQLAAASAEAVGGPTLLDTAIAKASQVFRIQAGHDTLLIGEAGTTVWVPAQAFEQQRMPVLSGEVEVQLREFYALSDMLLQGLATTAGPATLETAGMVHLAATANGQVCTLRRGSSLEVGFPTKTLQPDMQLFSGINKPGHTPDWRPVAQPWGRAMRERPWQRPLYPHGYGGMRAYLRRQMLFSAATAQRLEAQHRPRQVRRWLRYLGREQHTPLLGAVVATLELNASGQLTNVWLLSATDEELATEARRALQKLTTRWRPAATDQGQAVRSELTVDILFTADQRVLVEHLRWDERATRDMYRADQTRRQPPTTAQLRDATVPEAAAYVFRATTLGWLNCDRFLLFSGPLIRQQIALAGPPAAVSLVLKTRRSIVQGEERAGKVCFERVPKGEAATLVAIRRNQGQLYLAMSDIVIGQQAAPSLHFQLMTANELKAAVARLESAN
jgi:hypothetical protein